MWESSKIPVRTKPEDCMLKSKCAKCYKTEIEILYMHTQEGKCKLYPKIKMLWSSEKD